jgi:hypothetical protein
MDKWRGSRNKKQYEKNEKSPVSDDHYEWPQRVSKVKEYKIKEIISQFRTINLKFHP